MKTFGFWAGKVLSALVLIASAVLMYCLIQLKILPLELTVGIGVVLALITALVAVLTWTGRGKIRMSIGITLAVLMTALLALGDVYLWQTLDTIRNVSGGNTETVHVGIYVREEDLATYNERAAQLRYGILESVDRQSTDAALQALEENIGKKPLLKEYSRPPELINALINKEVDAIILNQAFWELYAEMPDMAEKMSGIREAVLKKMEVEIPPATTPPTDPNATGDEPVIQPPPENKSFCMYISGIDVAGSASVISRSDVNILAVVNPTSRQILLLSTPRDYYVPLKLKNGVSSTPDKLTHAGIYGVQVSMDTLELLYGVNVDYYFRVNFSGFKKIIEALGGVTVYSERAFSTTSLEYHYSYVKGPNKLNGAAALAFCRERGAFYDGDHQRGRNQMAMIKGVFDKLTSPALLTNYTGVLDAVEGSFKTSMPMDVIGELVASRLQDNRSWNIVSYAVTGTDGWKVPYSLTEQVWVMIPDTKSVEHAKELIKGIYNGETVQP